MTVNSRDDRIKRLKLRRRADKAEIQALELAAELVRVRGELAREQSDHAGAERALTEWRTRAESAERQRDGQATQIGDLMSLRDRLMCVADYLSHPHVNPKWWPEPLIPASAYALDLVRWADFAAVTGGFEWKEASGETWASRVGRRFEAEGRS